MSELQRKDVHLHALGAPSSGKLDENSSSYRNVTFHGWTSRERVFDYMSASDAIVIPSRWEGFGLVAAEAMRSGTAVIASNRGALPGDRGQWRNRADLRAQ